LIFVFYIHYLLYCHRHRIRQKKYGIIIICFLIFVVIYSLVPLHNYYFGNKWILPTTQAHIDYNLVLQPSKLLHIFSDEEVRQHVLNQLKLMFYLDWNSFYDKNFYTLKNFRFFLNLFLCLLLVSFLFNIGRLAKIIITPTKRIVMKKETIMNLLFILVPISFLFVYLFFRITVYYIRNIVMGYIMIYFFSVYSSSRLINWSYKRFEKILFLFKIKVLRNI